MSDTNISFLCEHEGCDNHGLDYVRIRSDEPDDKEWEEWKDEPIGLCSEHAEGRVRYSVEGKTLPQIPTDMVNQLNQLIKVTWDGDLISKDARDRLVKLGLVGRTCGYNFITAAGVETLVLAKALVP